VITTGHRRTGGHGAVSFAAARTRFEVRVLALPRSATRKPIRLIHPRTRERRILKLLKEAPPYVDYLIARTRQMDLTTGEGKQRALNFLLPYIQKIPNGICVRNGPRGSRNSFASMSRCCVRH